MSYVTGGESHRRGGGRRGGGGGSPSWDKIDRVQWDARKNMARTTARRAIFLEDTMHLALQCDQPPRDVTQNGLVGGS